MKSAPSSCAILHVDMDAFFASVSLRHRPELQDKPVIIGGGQRGVVLAANYPARTHGVRSGMPMLRAQRLCPQAAVLAPDYSEYELVSSSVMDLLREVTPAVQVASLDEAYLDVSGSSRCLGTPLEIAESIRARVADEQQIACSVGIAGSMPMAKLASCRAKPDGVFVLPPEQVASIVHPLDVGDLPGVGEKSRERLHKMGLFTVGDVAHTPLEILQRILGVAAGRNLQMLAWGANQHERVQVSDASGVDRSIGSERTFDKDTDDPVHLRREILRLSNKVGARARSARLVGQSVVLKLRFADFTTITRSGQFGEATDVTEMIYGQACRLFERLALQRVRIRLVGVRLEGLLPKEQVHKQMVLGERDCGWEELDAAVDAVALKYGQVMVAPAALL